MLFFHPSLVNVHALPSLLARWRVRFLGSTAGLVPRRAQLGTCRHHERVRVRPCPLEERLVESAAQLAVDVVVPKKLSTRATVLP